MKHKHSPGPWAIEPSLLAHTVCETSRHSVRAPRDQRVFDSNQSAYAVDEANARLIACSPELLYALKRLVEPSPDHEIHKLDLELARQIIARAEEGVEE